MGFICEHKVTTAACVSTFIADGMQTWGDQPGEDELRKSRNTYHYRRLPIFGLNDVPRDSAEKLSGLLLGSLPQATKGVSPSTLPWRPALESVQVHNTCDVIICSHFPL